MQRSRFVFSVTHPICDGIRFDEITLFPPKLQMMLVGRSLVWATEFEAEGQSWGGSVIASSTEEASSIADSRGLGERVFGRIGGLGDLQYLPDPD
ncbi:MAG: hypothetical protein JWM36_532 [Hyphomicrobiales bacterium]|nr:hypothetical protein [Hyphomicrobiales bacterium]